ncbi:hypothetical protein M407DRAFT_3410 [Tulasnella calospora MUT 4182]|uniref:NYN domain-containing protein n=1 Tax=Tulasnella calospora MUT 4182 TaxID=1051891 RepID=A0A0C3MME8_9AGAM|nr:hypothetical protein M407DRAFT_3410 [Tulasnella calospora MUT 4182]
MSLPTTVFKVFGGVITVLWDFNNSAVAAGAITSAAEQLRNSLRPIGEVAKFNAFLPYSSFFTDSRRYQGLLDAGIEVVGCPARQGKVDPVDTAIIRMLGSITQSPVKQLVILISGDGDFLAAAKAIRAAGHGFGLALWPNWQCSRDLLSEADLILRGKDLQFLGPHFDVGSNF